MLGAAASRVAAAAVLAAVLGLGWAGPKASACGYGCGYGGPRFHRAYWRGRRWWRW